MRKVPPQQFQPIALWNFPAAAAVQLMERKRGSIMFAFLLWCILFVMCWPLALLALVLYPFVWLFLLPFRIVGVAVHGVLEVVFLAITLPFRLLAAPFRI
jgi:hypothetical protein